MEQSTAAPQPGETLADIVRAAIHRSCCTLLASLHQHLCRLAQPIAAISTEEAPLSVPMCRAVSAPAPRHDPLKRAVR